jgi:hypothetical protein
VFLLLVCQVCFIHFQNILWADWRANDLISDIPDEGVFDAVAIKRRQLDRPPNAFDSMWRLIKSCMNIDPAARPSFAAISVSMKSISSEAVTLTQKMKETNSSVSVNGATLGGQLRHLATQQTSKNSNDSGIGSSRSGSSVPVSSTTAGKYRFDIHLRLFGP